jgi:hypothetical protein
MLAGPRLDWPACRFLLVDLVQWLLYWQYPFAVLPPAIAELQFHLCFGRAIIDCRESPCVVLLAILLRNPYRCRGG